MSTAVFLMNLGGPRDLAEVEPYLFDLFCDPLVIDLPLGPLRRPLARLIARRRAPSSAEKYRLIGGRSPLVEETLAQARALSRVLGPGFTTHLAMRCGHPSTEEGVREALAAGSEQAVALPLYPQWANATTLSSLRELRRLWPPERPLAEVCTFHDHPGYVGAVAGTVREAVEKVPADLRPGMLVVFSAHGLPLSQVRKGDPYPAYVEASCRAVAERLGLADWLVTYQSRVGPMKWLGPDTNQLIEARSRGRAVVAVPIAFVSEHLETLYDLDILSREAAERGGAAAYVRAAAVGTRPDFVAALADIVREAIRRQDASASRRDARGPTRARGESRARGFWIPD